MIILYTHMNQKQAYKNPYPRSAKVVNRTVKVDLGGGRSGNYNKLEIDFKDYEELLNNYSFDGLDQQPKPISLTFDKKSPLYIVGQHDPTCCITSSFTLRHALPVMVLCEARRTM